MVTLRYSTGPQIYRTDQCNDVVLRHLRALSQKWGRRRRRFINCLLTMRLTLLTYERIFVHIPPTTNNVTQTQTESRKKEEKKKIRSRTSHFRKRHTRPHSLSLSSLTLQIPPSTPK
ncbi:hypothetical protein RJT34_18699 [Clitoria ternatea]|uniref:Uncharacterized protein n=1 Tax=Clitoria ternatea TaxID=43366 RepID=A0AAN9PG47_CLITE